MIVYLYEEMSGEYRGETVTDIDPLESEAQGREVWLMPPNSTTVKPEEKEGFIPIWRGDGWELVEDLRGTEYWLPGDSWNTPARAHDDLGPLPEGALLEPPEPTRNEAAEMAISLIDETTSSAILAGFDYEKNGEKLHFSYDSFDQQNFADTANAAMMTMQGVEGLPTEITWNAYRNYTQETGGELVRLSLDAPTFLTLYTRGALAHKAAQMEIGGQRKAAINAAKTSEEINILLESWGLVVVVEAEEE